MHHVRAPFRLPWPFPPERLARRRDSKQMAEDVGRVMAGREQVRRDSEGPASVMSLGKLPNDPLHVAS